CTLSVSRLASCSQVMMMSSCPTTRPCSPGLTRGLISSQASGAPSRPCRGASCRRFKSERTKPMGRTEYEAAVVVVGCFLWVELFIAFSRRHRSGHAALKDGLLAGQVTLCASHFLIEQGGEKKQRKGRGPRQGRGLRRGAAQGG